MNIPVYDDVPMVEYDLHLGIALRVDGDTGPGDAAWGWCHDRINKLVAEAVTALGHTPVPQPYDPLDVWAGHCVEDLPIDLEAIRDQAVADTVAWWASDASPNGTLYDEDGNDLGPASRDQRDRLLGRGDCEIHVG